MTNPDMVKPGASGLPGPSGKPRIPEERLAQPVPAPESDPALRTDQDPLDSPQPKPMIDQRKSGGLKSPT